MIKSQNDVIAAIATPIGEGGISVIRVSGDGALRIVDRIFKGQHSLTSATSHTAHVGNILDVDNEVVDQVVSIIYRSPHSYTGDDTVEICCHGGIYLTGKVLEEILRAGARMAEPGEFTKRAFLNGKMDLSQAEAVADLIHAKTAFSHRTSLHQLQGKLSLRINALRENLIDICSLLELELDFSEEGIEVTNKNQIAEKIDNIIAHINSMLDSYRFGKISREGVRVVIAGKPNVGKSSIINNLLQENRAIVTEIPGTTRDLIQEDLNIDGVLFKISDTAGLRKTRDAIEHEGITRALDEISNSDLILFIIDIARPIDDEDRRIFSQIKNANQTALLIIVCNKIDLVHPDKIDFSSMFGNAPSFLNCSAKTGDGMDVLKKKMVESIIGQDMQIAEKSVGITDIRHKISLEKALENLKCSKVDLMAGKSNEFISLSMRLAIDNLGEIIGVVTSDDLLDNIFSRFCIGK